MPRPSATISLWISHPTPTPHPNPKYKISSPARVSEHIGILAYTLEKSFVTPVSSILAHNVFFLFMIFLFYDHIIRFYTIWCYALRERRANARNVRLYRGVPTYTQSTQMRTKIFQNKKKYMIFLLKQNKIIQMSSKLSQGFSKNNNFGKFKCNFAYHQKMSFNLYLHSGESTQHSTFMLIYNYI